MEDNPSTTACAELYSFIQNYSPEERKKGIPTHEALVVSNSSVQGGVVKINLELPILPILGTSEL